MMRTANASALGYAAFALTLWLASMAPAGWFGPPWHNHLLVPITAVLGGCALAVAGVLQWLRAHTLDATLFLLFAAYWWIMSLYQHAASMDAHSSISPAFLGWYYIVWAFVAFSMWIATFRGGTGRMLFTLGLFLSLLSAALANWLRLDVLMELSGYLGLVTAVVGMYIFAAEIINDVHGHTILPIGDSSRSREPTHPT